MSELGKTNPRRRVTETPLSIVTSVVATARTVSGVTPAVSVVRQAGVRHTLHEYEHDPNVRSFGDEAVEKLGWPAERVFKTLVVSVDGALQVACVPVSAQLDLKALGKRAKLADKDQAKG